MSPSLILDDDVSYFYYKDPTINEDIENFDEISVSVLIDQHHNFNKNSSIKTVFNWYIYYMNSSGDISSMRAYDCLNCELEDDGITYILSSGVWRAVNSDFKSIVEKYVEDCIDDKSRSEEHTSEL